MRSIGLINVHLYVFQRLCVEKHRVCPEDPALLTHQEAEERTMTVTVFLTFSTLCSNTGYRLPEALETCQTPRPSSTVPVPRTIAA